MALKNSANKRTSTKIAYADLLPTVFMPFAMGVASRRHHITLRLGIRQIRPHINILAEQERLVEEGHQPDAEAMANLRGVMISVSSLVQEVEQTCSKVVLEQEDVKIKYDLLREALRYIRQGVAEMYVLVFWKITTDKY